MLILSRRIGETLTIEPAQDLDPDMTVRELFASGPLVVAFMELNGRQARIGIAAPNVLKVVRSELLGVPTK